MAYNVSSDFRNKLYSGESQFRATLTIGEQVIDNSQIASISISSPIVDDSKQVFYVGSFISQKITIHFKNMDGIDVISGENVDLSIGQYVNNEWVDVPIGKFLIDDLAEDYYDKCEIDCYDYGVLFKPNIDYSPCFVDGKATIKTILEYICQQFSVELGDYPTVNDDVEIGTYDSTISGKQWISYIAEIKGCNAKIDRLGRLTLQPLKQPSSIPINALESESFETGEDYKITQVIFFDAVRNYTIGDVDGNTLYIRQDNPFINDINVVKNIYDTICTTKYSASGTSFDLDDVDAHNMILNTIYGETSQDTYSGKNLLNVNSPKTSNGITSTYNSDGSISFSGTASSNWADLTNLTDCVIPAGTKITFSIQSASSIRLNIYFDTSSTDRIFIGSGTTKATLTTTVAHTKAKLNIDQMTANNQYSGKIYAQLEIGDTPTTFEQYVGGTPSPNPDYPQEIHNVSGDNVIKDVGKNLANIYLGGLKNGDSREVNGITFTINQDGTISGHGTATAQSNFILFGGWSSLNNGYIQIDKNEYYSLSNNGSRDESGDTGRFYTRLARYNNGTISYTSVGDNTNFSGWEYVCLIMLTVASGQTVDFDNKWYQLEKGKIITPFEPYQEKQYKISLPVENLFQLPNTETANYITLTKNDDGTFNLSGTATAQTGFKLFVDYNEANIKDGKTYTFSANKSLPSGVSVRAEVYNDTTWVRAISNDLTSIAQTTTGTANLTGGNKIRYSIWVSNGTQVNITNCGIQLEEGTKANTYVPYGLVPIGENLFDKSSSIESGKYYDNTTGEIKTTSTANNYLQTSYIEVKPNTKYTISATSGSTYLRIVEYNGSKTFIKTNTSGTSNFMTITTNSNTRYFRLSMVGANVLDTLQLEEGSVSHANDHAIELNKITDYEDKIFKNSGKNIYYMDYDNVVSNWNELIINSTKTGYSISGTPTNTTGFTLVNRYMTLEAGTYTLILKNTSKLRVALSDRSYAQKVIILPDNKKEEFTLSERTDLCMTLGVVSGTAYSEENELMIVKGTNANEYEPYGNGDWYWKKAINKKILDNISSYSVALDTSSTNTTRVLVGAIKDAHSVRNFLPLSNRFIGLVNWGVDKEGCYSNGENIVFRINKSTGGTTTSSINSWLNSNHVSFYYGLEATQYNKITYQPLIDQLNAIQNDSLLEGTNHIAIEPNDLTPTIDIDYFENSNFTLTSLKTHNYGDFTLDAWDNIDYDLDGTHYLTLNNNEITYEMSIMSDVDTKIPTKQQEVTTNIVSGDDKTNIKKIKTRVDNLDASVEILSQQQTTTETNLSQLQIDVNGIEQNVEHIENVEINGENGLVSQIASVRTSVNNITNMFQITGGINVIRNSAFLLNDEVWEFTDNGSNPYHTELGNSYNSTLSGSTVSVAEIKLRSIKVKSKSENVTNLLVGTNYTFNFYHKQDNNMTTTIKMYSTENNSSKAFDDIVITGQQPMKSYSVSFTPSYTNYTIEIIVTSSANVGYAYLYDMMLNSGDIQSWQPASDEIYSTTLTMSRLGLKVYSSGDGTITLLGSDGMLTYETTDGKTLGRLVSSRTVDGDRTRNIVTQSIYLTRDITQENLSRWVETIINVSNRPYKVEYVESGE